MDPLISIAVDLEQVAESLSFSPAYELPVWELTLTTLNWCYISLNKRKVGGR